MDRTVIFLDIEGVLVAGPPRLSSNYEGLAEKLAIQHNNPVIAELPDLLCRQILDNFDKEACSHISRLCAEHQAEIVITSSWRLMHPLKHMQAIFQIAGISQVSDMVEEGSVRRDVIENYVKDHKIDSYIVLDDIDLSRVFGYRFIHCTRGFGTSQFAAALSALKCQSRHVFSSQFA